MAYVWDEIGRTVGLPAVFGGIPLNELGATGFGLAVCAEVLSQAKVFELAGARVVIQGFGAVGSHAARALGVRARQSSRSPTSGCDAGIPKGSMSRRCWHAQAE